MRDNNTRTFVIYLFFSKGALFNAPLGMISRVLASREAKRALQKSEVKVSKGRCLLFYSFCISFCQFFPLPFQVKGQDVIASYKVLVAVVLVPVAWTIYFLLFWFLFGFKTGLMFLIALPFFSYAAIRMLEQGVQIWRSTVPLLRSLTRSRFVETVKVREREILLFSL